jgi:hypothetical protein
LAINFAQNVAKPQVPSYSYGLTNNNNNTYTNSYYSSKALNNEQPTGATSTFNINGEKRAKTATALKQHDPQPHISRSPSRLDNNYNNSLNFSPNSKLNNTTTARNKTRSVSGRPLHSPTRLIYASVTANQNQNANNNYIFSSTNFNHDMHVKAAAAQAAATKGENDSVYDNMDNDLLVSRMLNNVQQTALRPIANRDEFRITAPCATNEIIRPSVAQQLDMNLEVELFEPSPYNIMSDPIISEQFKKLYEEDEYFRQIHRKCVEWLARYVFPEIEREREKSRKV